jgi:predicted RecB family nuclease
MSHPITSRLVVAASQCPRKAHFMLRADPVPHPHEYEQVVEERANRNRAEYLTAKNARHSHAIVVADLAAECDLVECSCRNKQEPHLVIGTHTPTSSDKLRLAFAGYALGEPARPRPSFGVIVPFREPPTRVNLESIYPTVLKIVAGLRGLISDHPSEPPPLSRGKYCQTCPFHDYCLAEAVRTDSLYLLDKMTPKLVTTYHNKGIFTLTQLSYLYRPRRRRKGSGKVFSLFNPELQALAIRTKQIYLHECPTQPQNPIELFLDIEGIPEQGFNYLIGVLVKEGAKTTMHSFWADTAKDESRIFAKCLEVIAKYPDAPIYHYGSYERRALDRAAESHHLDCRDSFRRMVNVNGIVYGKVYFPTYSNRLKDLGTAVGASWPIPNPSGIRSVAWRYRWEDSGQGEFKAMLLAYNQADCNALCVLVAELHALSQSADTRLDVDFANKPKQLCTPTGELIHRAFDGIINSAHLEYQQKRIRLKSRDAVGDHPAESPKSSNRPPLPSERRLPALTPMVIHVRRKLTCPRHTEQQLLPVNTTCQHFQIDLAFSKSGVRKRLVKYVGLKAACSVCGYRYSPPAISKLQGRKFGHRFLSWIAYQRIVLMLPVRPIAQTLAVLFAEHVGTSTICSFICQLSEDYAYTETLLWRGVQQSPFIHVDETKISIQGRQHYVWVLTDGKHVVFRLTDSRETAFLQKSLAGYSGVLVSDFYGGYDAFTCRQQKCLIHLIRDLNEDLWKNPFLPEYEIFVARVRDLLLPIFEDVGKYGLKKRHLQKHMKSVERFYSQSIDDVTWESDVIQTYQKRFVRYREALFLFLGEDGIPWNNNMGERAIRQLAIQRKISGSFFVRGASDYLRLLGISQSCRFQDKSFLRFLLSDERDVDTFNDHRRRRQLQ